MLRIETDNSVALLELGKIYRTHERWNAGLEVLERVIQMEPDMRLHTFLVDIYCVLECRYEAQEALKDGGNASVNPMCDTRFRLGLAYLMLDDKSSALKEYKILKDLDKDLATKLFKRISR